MMSNQIDFYQVKVLFKYYLKMNFRPKTETVETARKGFLKESSKLGIQYAVFFFMSLMFITILFSELSNFMVSLTYYTYSAFISCFLILYSLDTIIINPDDYEILGSRPVSTRTYFLARLLNLIAYISPIVILINFIPTIIYILGRDYFQVFIPAFNFMDGLLYLIIAFCNTFFYVFLLILLYNLIIRFVPYKKIQNSLVIGQVIFFLCFFLGYQYINANIRSVISSAAGIKEVIWLKFIPTAWFSYLFSYFTETGPLLYLLLGCFGIIIVIIIFLMSLRTISLENAEYIKRISSSIEDTDSEDNKTNNSFFNIIFKNHELKAAYIIISKYLKRDPIIKRKVFMFIGLIIGFLVMGELGIMEGFKIPNLFFSTDINKSTIGFTFATFLIIIYLTNFYFISSQTKDWKASWVYYLTLRDIKEFYMGIRIFTILFLFLPVFLIIFFFQVYRIPFTHALFQTSLIFLFTTIAMSIIGILKPTLPLSKPLGNRKEMMLVTMLVAPILVIIFMFTLRWIFYSKQYLLFLIGLILINYFLFKMECSRIKRKYTRLNFSG